MDVLGRCTAELHRAFCRSTGNPAFEPEPITPEDLTMWSDRLQAEVINTFDSLEKRRNDLSDELFIACNQLLSLRPVLLDRFSLSALAGISAAKMRYHGDYHLGQVLLVENDFIITDFEGEPARPMMDRIQKHSPLRDIACMLRSFSYASAVATNRATTERPTDRKRLGPLAQTWEIEVSDAFLKSYRANIRSCPILPADPGAIERLIEFFVIEKALYELRYEINNRPDWLSIPLFSLLRKLDRQQGEKS